MQTVVTHSGSFDPDDVLAVAALQLHLGIDGMKIIRSRDETIIKNADWVVDVGGVYDSENMRFDHHQNGVPKRENGVPYSAFGLLWREHGESICGSKEIANQIEERLVLSIDAADNHMAVCQPGYPHVTPFEFFDVIDSFKPVWNSAEDFDSQFLLAVDLARTLLQRLIAHSKARVELLAKVKSEYEAAKIKSSLIFDEPIPRHTLVDFKEVRVVVTPVPSPDSDNWMAAVVPVARHGFQNRAVFPEAWSGLCEAELAKISGVEGAVFCHKDRYIFVADSKEGAIKASHHARG